MFAVDDISSVGSAVESGTAANLAAAVSSGNGQQVKVELAALREYYFNVYELWQEFRKQATALPANPYDRECIATSGIPGVAKAIQASSTAALGSDQSMVQSLKAVDQLLSSHLVAIADTYKAYVNVDVEKASELKGAANSQVGGIGFTDQSNSLPALDLHNLSLF